MALDGEFGEFPTSCARALLPFSILSDKIRLDLHKKAPRERRFYFFSVPWRTSAALRDGRGVQTHAMPRRPFRRKRHKRVMVAAVADVKGAKVGKRERKGKERKYERRSGRASEYA